MRAVVLLVRKTLAIAGATAQPTKHNVTVLYKLKTNPRLPYRRPFWSLAKAISRSFCSPNSAQIRFSSGSVGCDQVDKAEVFASNTVSPPSPSSFCAPNYIVLPVVTTKKIPQVLFNLSISKPSDSDGNPSIILKKCAPELIPH